MKKIVYILLLLTGFTACSNNEVKIPEHIIPKDSMVFVLMDIHIAEAGVKSLPADSAAINNKTYYEFIFKKHHITEKQFNESLRFYTDHPKILEKIYIKMTEEMSKKEAEVINSR